MYSWCYLEDMHGMLSLLQYSISHANLLVSSYKCYDSNYRIHFNA